MLCSVLSAAYRTCAKQQEQQRACTPAGPRWPIFAAALPQRTGHSAPALSPLQLLNLETAKNQQRLFAALKEGTSAVKEMQTVGEGAGSAVAGLAVAAGDFTWPLGGAAGGGLHGMAAPDGLVTRSPDC